MGGSYQCHICLPEFSRSDSLSRHLESGICKQNEQSEDDPSDDSKSQQDNEDDNPTNEEEELLQRQSELDPWIKLIQLSYDSLQDTFDDTLKLTYNRILDGNCRGRNKDIWRIEIKLQASIILKLSWSRTNGKYLEKDPIHKQIVATAKRLRSEEDYDLAESYAWPLKKRNSSWREYLIIMKCQNCQQQKHYRELPKQSKWKQNKTRIYK